MLDLNITVQLDLTPQEFMLVRAALGGRLKDAHRQAAKELEGELAATFINKMRHRAHEVEKLAANIERATQLSSDTVRLNSPKETPLSGAL